MKLNIIYEYIRKQTILIHNICLIIVNNNNNNFYLENMFYQIYLKSFFVNLLLLFLKGFFKNQYKNYVL